VDGGAERGTHDELKTDGQHGVSASAGVAAV
jgi:hypothetical protein